MSLSFCIPFSGKTLLFVHVNKVPTNGNCTVNPLYGISMMDNFFVSCIGWEDPEDAGIKLYVISSISKGEEASLAKVSSFDPDAPLQISLGTGVHDISVMIEDAWGAKTVYKIPNQVVVDPIDPAEFEDFIKSGSLDELVGSGDKGALMMALQAQASVLADSDDTLINEESLIPSIPLTPEEQEFQKAVVKGQLKVDALDLITKSGGGMVNDMPSAEIVAKTVEAIIGEPPAEGEKSDIGLEATKTATNVLQELVDSIGNLDGVSEPSQITPALTSMTKAIGTLLEGIMSTSNVEPNKDSSADEVCSQLNPIDTVSADKPGVVEYDTDIGNDLEMSVPQDPQAQRCNGIIDAAKLTGESVGPQLLNMLSKMSQTLLAKSVVNEEQLIETPSVNIYAKL